MCGLVGFFDKTNKNGSDALSNIVTKMTDSIKYRGPDSSGVWVDDKMGIALGHRRLSIVDLSEHGSQPMVSSSGRLVVVYNGEIYNAEEIKKELLKKKYKFRGHSDTEVLLAACEEFGVKDAIKKTIGMFAFAIWDRKENLLYLARDRLGIKPLYWGMSNNILFFGSQLSSFFSHPSWRHKINQEALISYFQYSYVPTPLSIFEGIKKAKPGHLIVIDLDFNVQEICYWDFKEIVLNSVANKRKYTDDEAIGILDSLLRDAVKRRMIADVPVGAFLSGGIDSSIVVALMQAQHTQPVKTFSIGFFEKNYNEANHAKVVADYLETEHCELYVDSKQAQELIPSLPTWYDEPFADSSQIPTFLVSRLAKDHVKVSLSGDGGDELFAGYNRHFIAKDLWGICRVLPFWLRRLIAFGITRISPMGWDRFANFIPVLCKQNCVGEKTYKTALVMRAKNAYQVYKNLVSYWNINDIISTNDNFSFAEEMLKEELSCYKELSFLDWAQYFDTTTFLLDDILTKLDRASMAVSLEARVPLLDHRIVEFAWSLPVNFKIRNNQSKWLLRQVLYKYLPPNIVNRPKMGFGVPLGAWLRGSLRDWSEELLNKKNLEANGLKSELITQRWNEHKIGHQNWQNYLWIVLMYQQWCKKWLSRNN